MKQPVKGGGTVKRRKPRVIKGDPFGRHRRKSHRNFGTSKLEADFARDFLDEMGLTYIYQYEAKDIKRFFDFAVTADENVEYIYEEKEGVRSVKQDGRLFIPTLLIEVDGGYYHGDPRVVGDKGLNPMQKHNKFIDKLKDRWCEMHCIPLIRIWEYDIRNNPKEVMDRLHRYVAEGKRKTAARANRRRPH